MVMAIKHSTSDHISQCICLENRKKTPNSQQIAVQTRNKCRVFQKSTWKLFFFHLHNIFVFKFVSIPSMCSRYFLRIFAVNLIFRSFNTRKWKFSFKMFFSTSIYTVLQIWGYLWRFDAEKMHGEWSIAYNCLRHSNPPV